MTIRFLGLSDEERLAIEETTGIKTEGAQMIVDAAVMESRTRMDKAIRELQEVVGPHGSVTRLQAGGIRISPGTGVSVYEDGVLKTTIEPDGDLLAGSDITQAEYTTFAVFVNEQTYNNETMGAGDLLIGDNSSGSSNVKYDASEGQLQFREGTTVQVYMDTDGSIVAGSGGITIDATGIIFENTSGNLYFKNAAGSIANGTQINAASNDDFVIQNNGSGKAIKLTIELTDASTPYIKFYEQPAEANTAYCEINADTTPTQVSIGGSYANPGIKLRANKDGNETVFNDTSYDIDFRIEGATVDNVFKVDAGNDRVEFGADHYIPNRNSANKTTYFNEANQDMDFNVQGATDNSLLFIDASTDRIGVGIAAPTEKLDVAGNVNLAAGYNLKINGVTILSGAQVVDSVLSDWWAAHAYTWTYASASTFTVSGDHTSIFTTGTKLKWTQTTVKYGVVVSSSYSAPNTTVTIAVNTDYVISNAAISTPFYSRAVSPVGFPEYFNFAVSWTNVTVGNGTVVARYSIQGKQVDFEVSLKWGSTTSYSGTVSLAPPITALDYTQAYFPIGNCGLIDWATALYMGAAILQSTTSIEIRAIAAGGTYATWTNVSATVPHTWANTDLMTIIGRYFI